MLQDPGHLKPAISDFAPHTHARFWHDVFPELAGVSALTAPGLVGASTQRWPSTRFLPLIPLSNRPRDEMGCLRPSGCVCMCHLMRFGMAWAGATRVATAHEDSTCTVGDPASDEVFGPLVVLWKAADAKACSRGWFHCWYALVGVLNAYGEAYECLQGVYNKVARAPKWCKDIRYLAACMALNLTLVSGARWWAWGCA